MYNYFMLVGIIISDIEVREVADGKKVVNLSLSVRRDFKNSDGEFSRDIFRVSLWEFLADLANDTLKKGSRIGVKGRLYPKKEMHEEGFLIPVNELIAERIIFFDQPDKDFSEDNTEVVDESIEE